jgi:hypothetical protein
MNERIRASLVLLWAMASGACGAQSPVAPTPTPTPVPTSTPTPVSVTQSIRVVTSDGRDLGETSFEGIRGQTLSITLDDLRNRGIPLDSVDPTYFVLREVNQGSRLGGYVSRADVGAVYFAPTSGSRILWVMNATNHANYACAGATPYFLWDRLDNHSRYAAVQRLTPSNNTVAEFTVGDGDTTSIVAGLTMLNQAWLVGGVKYAELRWVGDDPGEIFAGLGTTKTFLSSGYHIENSYVVGPGLLPIIQSNVSVEEALEVLLTFDDLCGQNSVHSLFASPYVSSDLSPAGKDLVRFGALMRNLK